jgi:hypothetical protein
VTNRYRVGLITEGFLDGPIEHEAFIARPLTIDDANRPAAVTAWAIANGGRVERWNDGSGPKMPSIDLVALDVGFTAEDAKAAVDKGFDALPSLFRAIRFRQFLGSTRPLAVVATNVDDPRDSFARFDFVKTAQAYHEFEGQDTWDKAAEIIGIADSLNRSPTGELLADLFAQALGDLTLEGGIARLWSVLEILSERFAPERIGLLAAVRRVLRRRPRKDRGKLARVRAALAHVGLEDEGNLTAAYRARNQFVHEGRRLADRAAAQRLHMTLIRLVFLALVRTGFRPIKPSEPPFRVDAATPVRRVHLRHPGDHA